jgi:VIT1/CCC1 family predicted Fe2+/Mn2+ transporter
MSALPAFLIPALTGFAVSKLTGQSTKSSLRNALLGGLAGGITSGFSASTSQAGTAIPSAASM